MRGKSADIGGNMGDIYKHDYSDVKDKIYRKLHSIVFKSKEHNPKLDILYKSYWRSVIRGGKTNGDRSNFFYTQVPNRGAGFGHGLDIWRNGVKNAQLLGLRYAYTPMVSEKWDELLGFGEGEESVEALLNKGYKKVLLPYFDKSDKGSMELLDRIFRAYSGEKVIFYGEFEQESCEENDAYAFEYMRGHFWKSEARKSDKIFLDSDTVSVAVHIRRGDVAVAHANGDAKNEARWLELSYYKKLLQTIKNASNERKFTVYLFSEGQKEDFNELLDDGYNIVFCLDIEAEDSFLNMCYADILVVGMSSFSYNPGIINRGLKIAPVDFWLAYPESEDWVLADSNGNINDDAVRKITSLL